MPAHRRDAVASETPRMRGELALRERRAAARRARPPCSGRRHRWRAWARRDGAGGFGAHGLFLQKTISADSLLQKAAGVKRRDARAGAPGSGRPSAYSTIVTIGCDVELAVEVVELLARRRVDRAGQRTGSCPGSTRASRASPARSPARASARPSTIACAKPSCVRPITLIGNAVGNLSGGLRRSASWRAVVIRRKWRRGAAIASADAAPAAAASRPRPGTCSRASADAAAGRRGAACRRAAATATASRARTRAPSPRGRCARRGSSPRRPPRAPRRRSLPAARTSARASSRSARAAPRRRSTSRPCAAIPSMTLATCASSPPGNTYSSTKSPMPLPRLSRAERVVRDAVVQHQAARLQHPMDLAEVLRESARCRRARTCPTLAILS